MAQTQAPSKALTTIAERRDKIEAMLPSTMPGNKFMQAFSDAVRNEPKLKLCNPQSLYKAVSRAAADGLYINGIEAAIVPFGGDATYIPMVQGILKRMRNTGQIKSIKAGIVYAAEYMNGGFEYEEGTNGTLVHRPLLMGDRGSPVAAYSIAVLAGGVTDVCVMRADDILHIKKQARGAARSDSPWNTNEMEMWKKTVIRRHAKTLPLDSDQMRIFEHVDQLYDFGARRDLPAIKTSGAAAAILNAPKVDDQPEETGAVEAKATGKVQSGAKAKKPDPEPPQQDPEPEDADYHDVDDERDPLDYDD